MMRPFYIGLCTMLFLLACNRSNTLTTKDAKNDTIQMQAKDNAYMGSVYYRFPTPDEIFGFISNENLKFDPTLLNPPLNADTYVDTKSQTLGLGMYIADLAYITLFEAYSKSVEYYKLVHNLSETIKITSAYDLSISKRIEKNLLNLDSLKNISVDSYSSMVEFLIVNGREKTLAIIASGAYIECFYLAYSMAGKYSDKNPLILKITDLKYAFENLYSYLQIYSDDDAVKSIAEMLKPLSEMFSSMKESDMGKTTVKQEKNGNFVFGGGKKPTFSKELFEQLKTEVYKLRAKVNVAS